MNWLFQVYFTMILAGNFTLKSHHLFRVGPAVSNRIPSIEVYFPFIRSGSGICFLTEVGLEIFRSVPDGGLQPSEFVSNFIICPADAGHRLSRNFDWLTWLVWWRHGNQLFLEMWFGRFWAGSGASFKLDFYGERGLLSGRKSHL